MSFQVSNNCIIDVHAVEQESFMDWPIVFKITIKDSNGNIVDALEFTTPEGPYLKFYLDSLTANRLIIEGYERNVGIEKWVVLKPDELEQESKEISITGKFTLIEK